MFKCDKCGRADFAGPGQLTGHRKWCGVPFNEVAFWESMVRLPWSGCWVWMGAISDREYGVVARRIDGKQIATGAHRLAYQLTYGQLPFGKLVMHTCDVPTCCNPDHLRLGTDIENCADKVRKRRHCFGVKNAHAKLTEEQARHILSLKGNAAAGDLADQYGVRNGAIESIWAGRTWKHLLAAF